MTAFTTPSSPLRAGRANLPPLAIVLVHPEERRARVLQSLLPSPPHTLRVVQSPRQALETLQRHATDVLIMRLDPPHDEALHVLRYWRAHERVLQRVRCAAVALYAHFDPAAHARCVLAGFDSHLLDPPLPEAVDTCLHELVQQRSAATELNASIGLQTPARENDPVQVHPGMEPLLAEFLSVRRIQVRDMGAALAAGDRIQVARLAHRLIGSFAVFGFGWLSEVCRMIESEATTIAPERLTLLITEVERHLDHANIQIDPHAYDAYTGGAG